MTSGRIARQACSSQTRKRVSVAGNSDEWLWGWDPTPGIVSVYAESNGQATVWRRIPKTGELVREVERFRPWMLLDRIDDLKHLALVGRARGIASGCS